VDYQKSKKKDLQALELRIIAKGFQARDGKKPKGKNPRLKGGLEQVNACFNGKKSKPEKKERKTVTPTYFQNQVEGKRPRTRRHTTGGKGPKFVRRKKCRNALIRLLERTHGAKKNETNQRIQSVVGKRSPEQTKCQKEKASREVGVARKPLTRNVIRGRYGKGGSSEKENHNSLGNGKIRKIESLNSGAGAKRSRGRPHKTVTI